jgi:predicted ATPase
MRVEGDESPSNPLGTLPNNYKKYSSSGKDFYDEYAEEEGSEHSINDELDFSQMIGRQEELHTLHQVFTKVQKNGVSSVCLIEGLSGTGKSTLFHQFAGTQKVGPTNINRPHVLSGKFEELNGDPLSAIAEAYSGGLKNILRQDDDDDTEASSLKNHIVKQMRSQVRLLASILPDLREFIIDSGEDFDTSEPSKQSSLDILFDKEETGDDQEEAFLANKNTQHSLNRMKYMFKALSMTIATQERPIILFLDDLQWCDALSLEVLQSLLLDKELKHFFFVGAYRSDENPVAAALEESLPKQHWKNLKRANKTVVKIKLENLSLQQLCDFLKGLLLRADGDEEEGVGEEDEIRIREFAAALHPKTQGNIFYTRQVLEELYTNGNLTFSRMTFMWEWNLEGIEFSDNVLDAVTYRIQNRTSKVLQKLLTTAAYMRRTVDVDSLKAMIDLEGIFMLSRDDIIMELDEAVASGFLTNAAGSSEYSFAHDRIQQAVYELIPEGQERDGFELIPEGQERDGFRFSVGSRLYAISKNRNFIGGRDWMVYSAADHFNATNHVKNPFFLTMVNLKAGKKCMSVAAFKNASKYFAFGLKSLHKIQDYWDEHYKVALELYECMVEAELVQGHLDIGQSLAGTLLERARDVNDKLPTQLELAKALGRERSHKASFELSRSALQSTNMYSTTSFGIHANLVRDLLYVRRYFQKYSDEDILALPQSNDKHLGTVIALYENTIYQGWFCRNVAEFLAATLRSLRTSFQFGLSPHSGVAFMSYFMFCDNLGDKEGAHRFANLGLKILSRCEDKTPYCLQIFMKTLYLDAWSTNTKEVADLYEEGYRSGMEVGDLENGLMCRSARLDHLYIAGHSLALIEIQFADLVEEEDMHHMESIKRITVQHCFLIQYLRGNKGKHCNLDFDSLLEFDKDIAASDGSDTYSQLYAFRSRLQIAVYWGNYEFAERLVEKAVTMEDKSHSTMALRLFFLSITYGTLYRLTGRSRYRKRGKAAAAELKSISRAKGMNSWHRCVIASAHLKGCGVTRTRHKAGKTESVLKKYATGLKLAESRNHKQDVGLAAQLAAEYLMHADDKDNARITKYLNLAKDCYRDWGATSLVEYLEQKYSSFSQNLDHGDH